MQKIPTTTTISELKRSQGEVLLRVNDGPVMLLQNSKPAAIMVHPDSWNYLVDKLEKTLLLLESRRIAAKNDADDSWVSSEEARKRMAAHGIVES